MEAKRAKLEEDMSIAERDLINVQRRLTSCKELITDVKLGKVDGYTLSSLESLQKGLLIEELDARTSVRDTKHALERIIPEPVVLQTAWTSPAKDDPPSSSVKPKQLTLGNFFTVRTRTGTVLPLSGPKVIASDGTEACSACSKELKSIEGLREHQRWCAGYQELANATAQNARELKVASAKFKANDAMMSFKEDAEDNVDESLCEVDDDANSNDDESDATCGRAGDVTGNASGLGKKKGGQRGSDFRLSYNTELKYRVVLLVLAAMEDLSSKKGALTLVAEKTGIPYTNVHRWYGQRGALRKRMLSTRGKQGRGHRALASFNIVSRGPKPLFQAAEQVVLGKFDKSRTLGHRVGPQLIKTWMCKAVRELYPLNLAAVNFKASSTWLQRFLRRHSLCERRATNKKEVSVQERLIKVQRWHKRWQRDISTGESADPEFGRYKPYCIMNSDQVPFSIGDVITTTYEKVGAETVRISSQKGSDKRVATLQLCVSCDGNQGFPLRQCKPMIIFMGAGNITTEERDAHDKRVVVMFQKKAWMDSVIFEKWVQGPLAEHVQQNLPPGPKVMILDNLRAQTNDESGNSLLSLGIDRRLLPAGVTDMMQPIDQNVGYDVKRRMVEILNNMLVNDDSFCDRWFGREGHPTFPAKQRRVVITQLLGEAWEDLCIKKDFLALGLNTGCVMPRVGVPREHPRINGRSISIKGVNSYAFEHINLESSVPETEETNPDEAEATATAAEPYVSQELTEDEAKKLTLPQCALYSVGELPLVGKRKREEVTITLDSNPEDALLDDTDSPPEQPIEAPSGYCFEERPDSLPPISRWVNRIAYWRSELSNGEELGWIKAEIIGGPSDPSAAVSGVTMRLKCSKRMDPSTPSCLNSKQSCVVQVALTPDNYGRKWFLMKKL